METEIAKKIVKVVNQQLEDISAELYEGYQGRGYSTRGVTAISVDDRYDPKGTLIKGIANAIGDGSLTMEEVEAMLAELGMAGTDSLGMGSIIY
ncbi:hypothetical protein [Vibrio agarivorans]|uniref:hypothetical protein n=1 Tax=Vibrio agarivorans TaxID=153622 RepID=UPI0025B45943|nr:hypothetical protein [Vibrio agarivorans]MDN3661132.1 hypothetical protein [Vibrio agarivorans]